MVFTLGDVHISGFFTMKGFTVILRGVFKLWYRVCHTICRLLKDGSSLKFEEGVMTVTGLWINLDLLHVCVNCFFPRVWLIYPENLCRFLTDDSSLKFEEESLMTVTGLWINLDLLQVCVNWPFPESRWSTLKSSRFHP